MNRYINAALVTLGIIFLAIIFVVLGAYLALSYTSFGSSSPLGMAARSVVRPVSTAPETTSNPTTQTTASNSVSSSGSFTISDAQKQAIAAFGIDPATIPSTISPAQEVCFTEKLGAPRVAEIKAGAVPSAMDFFKAKTCLSST